MDIHTCDDIRPYLSEELPAIYSRLLQDPNFLSAVETIYPGMSQDEMKALLATCTTNQLFQKKCIYPMLQDILRKASTGLTYDITNVTTATTHKDGIQDRGYTFITNHRDIILDSAFLDCVLFEEDMDTVEIAIGDNLLIYPWIKDLVRISRSFIVQRALTMRQMLTASKKMSDYMHYVIQGKHSNLWIAQREGRAKDSDDRTQDSVLKMLAMGAYTDAPTPARTIIDSLMELNITPMSISYEYDPCDHLKAMEFQCKRDNPDWKKAPQDDLINMKTGMFGYKGHIHYHAAPCINDWISTLPADMPKTELFNHISAHIDHEIHSTYHLYPGNYCAADLLHGTTSLSSHYTAEDKARFEAYLEKKLSLITLSNPDIQYLRQRLLVMYANPVINQQKAQQS